MMESNQQGVTPTSEQELKNLVSTTNISSHQDGRVGSDLESDKDKGQGFYRLAKIFYDKADLVKAKEYFEKAMEFSELPRDIYGQFKTLGFLVRIASEMMDQQSLHKYTQESEKLLEMYTSQMGSLSAEYFYNAGQICFYSGKSEESRQNFIIGLKKSREQNEPEVLAKSLYALSMDYFRSSELDTALAYLNQLNELLPILKKNYLFGTMQLLFARIWMQKGDFENCLHYLKSAHQSLVSKNCWNLSAYILYTYGTIYKQKGDYNKALVYFELALSSAHPKSFKRLTQLLKSEISDVNDSAVDLYLDRHNRLVHEKNLGTIDFKHRFVLLEILFLLAQNPGEYYNKDELAQTIWKDEYNPLIHDKLIYTSISRLRKLIEPKSSKRKYILRGKDGYTFNPSVKARFQKENELNVQNRIGNIELNNPV